MNSRKCIGFYFQTMIVADLNASLLKCLTNNIKQVIKKKKNVNSNFNYLGTFWELFISQLEVMKQDVLT